MAPDGGEQETCVSRAYTFLPLRGECRVANCGVAGAKGLPLAWAEACASVRTHTELWSEKATMEEQQRQLSSHHVDLSTCSVKVMPVLYWPGSRVMGTIDITLWKVEATANALQKCAIGLMRESM